MAVTNQESLDRALCECDGSPNNGRLGANAIRGVSLACAHAAAAAQELPLWRYLHSLYEGLSTHQGRPPSQPMLPLPMVNLISGGLHAGGNLDLQDVLLLPIGAASFSEALEMAVHVYRSLGATLVRHGFEGVLVGDEGGFGPRLQDNEQALQLIVEAIDRAGYEPGRQAAIALDVASTHFYRDGRYHLGRTTGTPLTADAMVDLLQSWVERYPIQSIEDGLAEDD